MDVRGKSLRLWRLLGNEDPPFLLKYRSSSFFILSTVSIAVFTDIFMYAVIVPVIPFALSNRAGVADKDVQHWVSVLLAVYGAALLGASPICGWFADKSSNRRLPLLFGLVALAGSTLLLCLGKSIALLILGRILQGISAAIVWTVGLALLADTVGSDKIGHAAGYVSISMSVAILIAPLLGGVVYDKVGYFPVYYMVFGMILLDIMLRLVLVEKKVARRWISSKQTVSPARAHVQSGTKDVSTIRAGSKNAVGTAVDPEAPASMTVPPAAPPSVIKMLRKPRLLAGLFTALTQALLLTAWDAVLPLQVSALFHWSSLGAGLIFLPLILPSFASPLVGIWADRQGARMPVVIGFAIAIPFLICLLFVDGPDGSGVGDVKKVVLLCALLAGVGISLAMAMVPLLAEIVFVLEQEFPTANDATQRTTITPAAVPSAINATDEIQPNTTSPPSHHQPTPEQKTNEEDKHNGGKNAYATAYGLFNAAFAGGMLVGPLFGGFVRVHAGWGTMCWSLGLMSLAGVAAACFVGEKWVDRRGRERIDRRERAKKASKNKAAVGSTIGVADDFSEKV